MTDNRTIGNMVQAAFLLGLIRLRLRLSAMIIRWQKRRPAPDRNNRSP